MASDVQDHNLTSRVDINLALKLRVHNKELEMQIQRHDYVVIIASLKIRGQSSAFPIKRLIHQYSIQMESKSEALYIIVALPIGGLSHLQLSGQSEALYTIVAPPAGGHSTLQLPYQMEFFLLQ
ncbi:hypothetical protein HAX54_047263, partial [Datura stramonium]|nr:hypothetical protein [Datura stramonium]